MGKISDEKLNKEIASIETLLKKEYVKKSFDVVQKMNNGESFEEVKEDVKDIRKLSIKDKDFLKGDICINLVLLFAKKYNINSLDDLLREEPEEPEEPKEEVKFWENAKGRTSQFTEKQAEHMKYLHEEKKYTYIAIAELYNINPRQVSRLVRGQVKNLRK